VNGGKLDTVVSDIGQTADEDLQGTGVTAELTGVPIMQLAIRHALDRDRIQYAEAKEGSALNPSIVCTSESFKLNITSYGNFARRIRSRDRTYLGGLGSKANLAPSPLPPRSRSHPTAGTQAVNIQPRGGDVSDVDIELKRSG
jgi:hypothetical protein